MELLLFVILVVMWYHTTKRVGALEELIKKGQIKTASRQSSPVPEEVLPTAGYESKAEGLTEAKVAETEQAIAAIQEKPNALLEWLKTDWLMKLGALLILLGFGWLVSYAFMNNWIGPMGRVTLGLLAGIGIMFFGEKRMDKAKQQAAVLMGLGAGVVMITIFAARQMYDFFTPASALLVMALVSALVAFSSLRNRYKPLAVLGLTLGFIAPLLTNSPDPTMEGLYSYLFVITLGYLWVVRLTGWRLLIILSVIFVFIYSLPYMGGLESFKENMGLFIACVFSAMFYLANLAGIMFSGKAKRSDIAVSALVGLFFLAWIGTTAPDELKWLFSTAAGLFCVTGAFFIFKFSGLRDPIYVYSAKALVYLGAAAAFELDGPTLVIVYALMALAVTFLHGKLTRDYYATQRVSFLILIPTLLSVESLEMHRWRDALIHDDFIVLVVMALAYFVLAFYFQKYYPADTDKNYLKNLAAYNIAGGFYALALIWYGLYAVMERAETARIIALFIYTVIGLSLYLYGYTRNKKAFYISAEVLLGLVVLRLLFVEVWHMAIAGRIITFIFIGAMLISSAFIKKPSSVKSPHSSSL